MEQILSLNPLTLFVLLIAGGGVIYVTRFFAQAQIERDKAFFAAWESNQQKTAEMQQTWLAALSQLQQDNNDAVMELTKQVALNTHEVAELRRTITTILNYVNVNQPKDSQN